MNLFTQERVTHRTCLQNKDRQTQRADVLPKGEWGKDGLGVWGSQMQTVTYKMDKQQGPTV